MNYEVNYPKIGHSFHSNFSLGLELLGQILGPNLVQFGTMKVGLQFFSFQIKTNVQLKMEDVSTFAAILLDPIIARVSKVHQYM